MKLNNLLKVSARSKKIVGRGIGSGKGKQAGRGTKGQKARGKIPAGFIGGTLPLYKKLPYNRGQRNMKSRSVALAVTLTRLSVFKSGADIDMQALIDNKIISSVDAKKRGAKIVGIGEVPTKLTIKVPISAGAAKIIETAGGTVVRG
ncbi:MAG: 50S ribosomal protein L15 [Candidatus Daviesbacteria bacterium]|nr:50S ribosomal protein L15 [Candidatus Daviesbacteria bacterium]